MNGRTTRLLLILAALLVPAALPAGGRNEAPSPDRGTDRQATSAAVPAVELVATTSIVGDVVRNVAGDLASLTVLIPPGQNPHSFEPKPSSMRAVEQADVVFTNGFDLEEALLTDVEAIARGPVVPLSRGVEPRELESREHDHGVDPHVWMDPKNVLIWVTNVVEALADADPEHETIYRSNGETYSAQLRELDSTIREMVSQIPPENRVLVLGHDSFSYFATAYGFTIAGSIVPPAGGGGEPSAREVADLVETMKSSGVTTIFVEYGASRSLQGLARQVAQEVDTSVSLVETRSASLGAAGEPGDTYLSMMLYNARQVVSGLIRTP